MAKKFYITTPLYYVNAPAHIGHSYTNIAADTLARYMRSLIGPENVRFLTGTDEHGQKIYRAAVAAGLEPKAFVDKMSGQFKELWKALGISYDDFIRTTEPRHILTVTKILEILYKNGDIYQNKYEGWYCTPCETFLTQTQMIDSLCPDCKRPVEKILETNYFFKLAKYQDWLLSYIRDNPDFIRPQIRRNEVLSFLELNRLTDLCVSRPKERLSWGIPLPFSPDHVTYVWFDALINYISAVGEFDASGRYISKWWPADIHFIGKDILRQHAIYWPIMLKALGIELPKAVLAHGWWMIGDNKMSKSRGNVVHPAEIAAKFGVDVYRYFLLRDVPFGLDGNFSQEAIIRRFNGDLANDLGNLLYRTLTMIEKYFSGGIPQSKTRPHDQNCKIIINKIEDIGSEIARALSIMQDCNFSAALGEIWSLINMANKYVEETKPWNLAKEAKTKELEGFILVLVDVIRKVQKEVAPFMPATSLAIKEQFGDTRIKKADPLFPRIDLKGITK
jgi:methionyl-tRNA synthetase